ncbi:MAG TPA: rhomboid family intramembrane serine protease [Bellilinea sp.]|nr:rhomboid family intramembrane serine protease [Bellilinea sp.]
MIPIGDDNSRRRIVPVVTYGIILLNAIMFFMELTQGEPFIMKWSFIPAEFMRNPAGEMITIFTAMFMHGGWMHILSNMLYLWIFGDNVEDAFGHIPYLIFYLVSGIAATFAQLFVDPNSTIPNLGASGAIAGVLGAYLVLYPRGTVRVIFGRALTNMPALIVIGLWAVLQLISGLGSITASGQQGGVAYMAHVGGFIAGLVLTFLLKGRRKDLQA